MNEALVVNWNARVALGDTVYVLGDFGLGKPESILPWRARMNGTVVLIRGNHDRIGKGYAAALNMQVVNGDAELTLEGVTFHLSHYPRPLSEKIPGRTHLFGHVHGRYRVRDGMLNVGVDVWGFRPITPEEALLALKE
jgi:calcineurin-like phosphoesterase family protein